MSALGMLTLALIVAVYSGYYARVNFKQKNKLGGTAIIVLAIVSIVSPVIYLFVLN